MHLVAILAALTLASSSLSAQDTTLRVLRHTPGDTTSPGTVITVTFDRPVAGRLDSSVDAARIFSIEPAIAGKVSWRDPITIRFIPDEPLPPGAELSVRVDTAFRALDGSRLPRPYRFTFRVPGARLLARSFDGYSSGPALLPLDGRIRLLYGAPVDLGALRRGARLELGGCEGGSTKHVALRPVQQRPVSDDDPYPFRYAGGWDRDTLGDRFRRLVELEPERPLPLDCSGQLVLPNTAADAMHGAEERFAVLTQPNFRLRDVECSRGGACAPDRLVLEFTAPVKRADVERHVRIEPAVPFTVHQEYSTRQSQWRLDLRLAARSTYTVVINSAIRDVHGRPLQGAHRVQVRTGDYLPSLAYPHGALTIPRNGPRTIPVRYVNVHTVRMVSYRVPDTDRARALSAVPGRLKQDVIDPLRWRAETTLVTLNARFNVDTATELPLPPAVTSAGAGLVALRLEIAKRMESPDPVRTRPPDIAYLRLDGWYTTEFALVQLSDLAVHAKIAREMGAAFVTGLTDGRPRAGATVRQLAAAGNVLSQGVTGADGMAVLQPVGEREESATPSRRKPISDDWPPTGGLVEAELGGDRVVTAISMRGLGYLPQQPLDVNRLGGRQEIDVPVAAAIFAERGIYRPGEMLYLKGVVRQGVLGALALPPVADSARITLTYRPNPWEDDDEDVIIRDTVVTMTDFGTVTDSLRLRATAPLGTYIAALRIIDRGSWHTVAADSLRVAEYRVPEFLVEARTDSTPRFGGDTIHVQATGRYLFGAPMGRAYVQWSAVLHETTPWELSIPGAEGWAVGEWSWWSWRDDEPEHPYRLMGEDTLDTAGRVELQVPVAELRPSRPGRVDITVAVVDVNRQVVTTSTEVPVHPANVYVLARQQTRAWFWKTRERAAIEVRTVRPDGAVARGVAVAIAVVRREWRADTTGDGYSGRWVEVQVRTDTVRTGDRPVPYTFVPTVGGIYELRLSAEDGRGGVARTTLSTCVVEAGMTWWTRSPFHLPLVTDPRELTVGEETQVVFESPFDRAEAWVTIERERVLEQRRITTKRGANTVPIRLGLQHAPNVFVSVVLVRQGGVPKKQRPDSAAQLLRAGYAELRVSPAPKRLSVSVAPLRAEYGPGDSVAVQLRVRDVSGRGVRSEVTLWAVDQGVLALTAFQTPDLVARMYEPRGVGARFASTLPTILAGDPRLLAELATRFTLTSHLSANVVATGAQGAIQVTTPMHGVLRSRFRSTAFYLGTALTDDSGHAVARARLPDNLTTFRVMSVAVSGDDRFGSGDTTLLVTRPLVARPTLPRFVRAGDSLLAGAMVNARDGRARPVRVDAESDGVELRGEAHREIMLAEGKGAEARFTFAVPPRDSVRDTVVVRLGATDGSNADAVEMRLAVRPDFHPRTHTRIGVLRDAAEVVLQLPAEIDPARSRLSLRLGTSPLAPMLAAYDWLRVYPYDCTEQIASAGRALIAVWRATRERDPAALGGDPRPRLQDLADELARRQRTDGAIKYWSDHEWSSPWLSTHAGLFLLDARDLGVAVDSTVVNRLARYLSERAAAPIDSGGMNRFERRSRRLALGDRVAALEFLRRAGAPAIEAENSLLRLAPAMTWEDRLRLAEVLASRTDVGSQAGALVDAAWRAVVVAGRRVDLPDSAHAERAFPSRVAPAARLLTASLALRPEHPLLGGLIETVLQHGRAERGWAWGTQDYASVVLALAALSDTGGAAREVRILGGGRTLLSQRVGDADAAPTVPLTGLLERGPRGQIQLRLKLNATHGAGPVYYAINVEEVPSQPPVTPDIQGIVVERWDERFDDGRPVTEVNEGDLVRVRLRVTVPADRQFVAVEDPLPAGLEPVDLSLRTSGSLQPFVTPESERARMAGDRDRDGPGWQAWLYGSWDDGWWSPWEHKAIHDDRVVYFARMLWAGSYTASYVARATTAGKFVRPPAHAEEMYNPALQGRSDGGGFHVHGGPD